MNLTECLPHPQSEKSFNAEEAIEELRRKLKAAFPFFLNDLLVRSSWEIVKLYPVKGLTAVRVTMLRNILCQPALELSPRFKKYQAELPRSPLVLAYSSLDEEQKSAA